MMKLQILFLTILLSYSPLSAESHSFAVLELFTSQGCSSCPPADNLLTKIAEDNRQNPEVLVLSYHVDYWNSLGWADPYSLKSSSKLQRRLASSLSSGVFTPQIVLNGDKSTVGSKASEVYSALKISKKQATEKLIKKASVAGETFHMELFTPGSYVVQVISYTDLEINTIPRGENSGRKLSHTHSVSSIQEFFVADKLVVKSLLENDVSKLSAVVLLRDKNSLAIRDFALL